MLLANLTVSSLYYSAGIVVCCFLDDGFVVYLVSVMRFLSTRTMAVLSFSVKFIYRVHCAIYSEPRGAKRLDCVLMCVLPASSLVCYL